MATSALDITEAEKEEMRAYWRKKSQERDEELERKQERAWEAARVAAAFLRERFGAQRVLLYGSLARGDFTHWSDVDIAVWGTAGDDWLKTMGGPLETSTEFEVNVVRAEQLRPAFLASVERDGVEL